MAVDLQNTVASLLIKDKIARDTGSRAEDGGSAVEKNIEAMKLIDKSSEQIAEVIGVISKIAAQTQLEHQAVRRARDRRPSPKASNRPVVPNSARTARRVGHERASRVWG